MVKKAKGKHRLDKFYHLAKEQGYRSRAAFKLIQLNRKYSFLENSKTLLDLCAAPGGWLQVAVKHMPMSSLIIGIDLAPIRTIKGCKTLVGDITTQKSRLAIKKEAGGSLMDTVIHDGAPNVGGAWASEAYSQSWLVLESLKLACDFLAPRGTFVTKIFRSQDYNALLYAFNQLFAKVEATKPAASRNTSAEIFVVCLGYKAPAKIDPRLLDAKHLFRDVTDAPKNMGPDALLKQKVKQKRFREGYEEGLSTMHKPCSAASFILSDAPVEMLGQFSQFALQGPTAETFPGAELAPEFADFVEAHPATQAEIKALCQDLQVLGRSEFKQLLKWRLAVKKAWAVHLAEQQQKTSGTAGSDDEEEDVEADIDPEAAAEDALLGEMAAVKAGMERRQKREKKRRLEQKKKSRVRAAQAAAGEGVNADEGNELFSLAALRGKGGLAEQAEVPAPTEEEMEALEADTDEEEAAEHSSDNNDDTDEDESVLEMEEDLDAAYQSYCQRQGHRAEKERQKRRRLGMDGELGSDEEEAAKAAAEYEPGSDAEEAEEEPGQELLVDLDDRRSGRPTSGAAVAAQWFAQPIFGNTDLEDEEDEEQPMPSSSGRQQAQAKGTAMAKTKAGPISKAGSMTPKVAGAIAAPSQGLLSQAAATAVAEAADSDDADEGSAPSSSSDDASQGMEDDNDDVAQARIDSGAAAAPSGDKSGFEEVPVSRQHRASGAGSSGESSDDEFDDLDDDGKAEVLALAKKMLRGRERQDIMDAAYHRYAFHETGLPDWFKADEGRHMKPPPVISQEEVQAEKERLKAIDARPIKKVAEAKARKQKRMASKLDAARAKAEAISGQEDLPMGSKMKEIQKLMAKAKASGKGKGKKKPSRSDQYNKGKPLDRRMFSDKRAVNFKAKKKAAKKSKSKGKKGGAGKSR